ncbi:uncharacterized protein LOC134699772 isoform X2 [Mytilus trossulus]|uniref:uncharacterized protein LOC134699772 isoform X2 n=1 Tax=Mytilus trossulus TaxID=6551 RepID=UPI0030079CD0
MTYNVTVNWSIIVNKTYKSSVEMIDEKGLKWISLIILLGIIFLNILVVVLLVSRKPKSRMRFFVANLAIAGKLYRYGLAMSSWMIGCILAIPYGVFGTYNEEEVYCSHEAPSLVMLYLDLCTIIIIPLLIISVCYIIIIIKLCERKRGEIILDKDSDDDCDIDVKHQATTKAKVRTIKLVCVVFLDFNVLKKYLREKKQLKHYAILQADKIIIVRWNRACTLTH